MYDHRSGYDVNAAKLRAPFLPDMPQDNYDNGAHAGTNAPRIASVARSHSLLRMRETVQDSLNRRA